jgi:AcrR family transcriptional regulator
MSSVADKASNTPEAAPVSQASTARRPRRHDAEASRAALLAAAAALFEERGYDAATVREIGERAGVDAALIARYFGGKEGLYLAALQDGAGPAPPDDPAAALAWMLDRSDENGRGPIPHAMVSPTLSESVREQVQEILRRRAIEPLAASLGGADARLRAEVLVAIATGIALTRAGGTLPALAEAPLEEIAKLLEPLTRPDQRSSPIAARLRGAT